MYTVDEADYAILSQVKNQEFAAEVAKTRRRDPRETAVRAENYATYCQKIMHGK